MLKDHGLGKLLTDDHDWVEGTKRVLEDHRDLDASKFGEFLFGDLEEVFAIIDDLTVFDDLVVGEDA